MYYYGLMRPGFTKLVVKVNFLENISRGENVNGEK